MKNRPKGIQQLPYNRYLVIQLLRKEGFTSRAILSEKSGLTPATITNIIGEFIGDGLVRESGFIDGEKGRRSIGIKLDDSKFGVVAVVVTRKYFEICFMGISGEVKSHNSVTIKSGSSSRAVLEEIKREISRIITEKKGTEIVMISVALPGPYKRDEDELVFVTNLVHDEDFPILEFLQEGFDIPVCVENDANAAAFASFWFEEEGKYDDLCYIVAGQGIGCGIISEGKILKGHMGIAGEIGHTTINYDGAKCECGNNGCLEMYSSYLALEKNILHEINFLKRKSVLTNDFSIADLKAAIEQGDPVAIQEYSKVCEFLSVGVVNLINLVNPAKIILGDLLSKLAPDILLETVKTRIRNNVRPMVQDATEIVIECFETNTILLGAGALAIQKFFEDLYRF